MAFVLAIIAVLAFANPDISILDLVPDVIGCAALYFALKKPAEFSSKLESARSGYLKLTVLTAAKFIASRLINADDGVMILLSAFCFGVAEAVMLYGTSTLTFDGLSFLGTRFDGDSVYFSRSDAYIAKKTERINAAYGSAVESISAKYGNDEAKKKLSLEKEMRLRDESLEKISQDRLGFLLRRTHIFIIIRAALNILPEMTALSSYESSGVVSGYNINIYDFRGMFVTLASAASFIVGVIWLITVLKYIIGIRRDRTFVSELRDAYENEVLTRSDIISYRRMKAATYVLTVAVILTFDLTIDYKNIFPDFAAALMLILFFAVVMNEKRDVTGLIFSFLYGIAAAAQWLSVRSYIDRFTDFTRTVKSDAAMKSYIVCCAVTLAAEALFVLALISVKKKLDFIIDSHTGYVPASGDVDEKSATREKLHRETTAFCVLGIVSAAVSVLYMVMIGINKPMEAKVDGVRYVFYVPVFSSITLVTAIVSIVFFVFAIKYLSDVRDGLDERYDLE